MDGWMDTELCISFRSSSVIWRQLPYDNARLCMVKRILSLGGFNPGTAGTVAIRCHLWSKRFCATYSLV